MAKLSVIQRQEKREKLVAKYAKKYAELKAVANDAQRSDEERYGAHLARRQVRQEVRRTEGGGERRAALGRRALWRPSRTAEAAAQREPDPAAQPLRPD